MSKAVILAAIALAGSSSAALAVSEIVKEACRSDYFAYCSNYEVGSSALRACMSSHRKMLSGPCIKALGSSGEATQDDVQQYKREMSKN
jgi:hypothetical protein